LVAHLGIVKIPFVYSVTDTGGVTSRAELGESSSVTPSNGSAGRTELNTSQSRHIVAQDGLSELDGVREEGSRRLSLRIEAIGKVLEIENFTGDHHGEELFWRSRKSVTDGLTNIHGDLGDSGKLLRGLLLDLVLTRNGHDVGEM
jgi:hypothetical protein